MRNESLQLLTENIFNETSDFDHTRGEGGHFMFISSTNRDQIDTKARLISFPQPPADPNADNQQVSFLKMIHIL